MGRPPAWLTSPARHTSKSLIDVGDASLISEDRPLVPTCLFLLQPGQGRGHATSKGLRAATLEITT